MKDMPCLPTRLRRLRHLPVIRELVQETFIQPTDLILPLFIKAGIKNNEPISSMPGHFQFALQGLTKEIKEIKSLGLNAIMIFGVPEKKDALGSDSFSDHGIMQQAIKIIKDTEPELLVISDICLCQYTSHGHCGFINDKTGRPDIDNDKTLALLQKQVISHAKAGTDMLAPSGMIDGMIAAIRNALDEEGFEHLPTLSYSVKYASSMYGPFREATEGAPKFGDRKTHQIDPANGDIAFREAALDLEEGADMLMVKPAHTYLDVIYRLKQAYPGVPLGAYHPSGEFAMIKAAAEKGWLDEKKAALEVLTSIKRAGADFILTYFAKQFCKWYQD
ncbi:MAG: delta-aminolevulinic acid dehydratase [Gammaproteobacteria bacterium RIFCSPHIGHO2_12_FULL_35_23]|nr:MAG: delta-aminolevulinic acid dehydratase [Gammaproteobacteria bacterium RIFCSPHIGHO2_12_FULL_35_23]